MTSNVFILIWFAHSQRFDKKNSRKPKTDFSFPLLRRGSISRHYGISNLAGETKNEARIAADRWLHSNASPCLRRSTKGGSASEGNWKMTRRALWVHRGGKDASVKARCGGEWGIATYKRRREWKEKRKREKKRKSTRARCIAGKEGTRIKGH